jgi:hypothetical protein
MDVHTRLDNNDPDVLRWKQRKHIKHKHPPTPTQDNEHGDLLCVGHVTMVT